MSFPRYPSYKDSGVEWLGAVPAHWEICALKRIVSMQSGESITGESIADSGEYPVFGGNGMRGYTAAYTHEGDYVLIGRQGALCGNINYGAGRFWASEHAVVVTPLRDVKVTWLGELLKAMNLNQYSVAAAQPGLSVDLVGRNAICLPPLAEQTQIAAFLDRETAKIDALVAEQRRLMELLKEKRQAVISHAVTKGLNPNAPMKSSGIEWLGDVPEHWEVKRLRDVATLNPSKSEIARLERESFVSFLPMSAIGEDGSLNLDSEKTVGELENGYTFFRNGDVTIAKITPCYENGKGALMQGLTQGVGFGTTELIVVRPRQEESCGEFLHFLFVSTVFRNIGESHMYGAGGQKRVPDDFVRNFATGFPPAPEQAAIAAHLDAALVRFDTLTAEAQNAIDLLQERRTALISAAVTGQIDVRHLA